MTEVRKPQGIYIQQNPLFAGFGEGLNGVQQGEALLHIGCRRMKTCTVVARKRQNGPKSGIIILNWRKNSRVCNKFQFLLH
jgi:hypothetical protein